MHYNTNSRIVYFSSLLFFITIIYSNIVKATSDCYVENEYPNIIAIREENNSLEFIASGKNFNNETKSAPVITLTSDKSWDNRTWARTGSEKCATAECASASQRCDVDIPEIQLSVQEALSLRSFKYMPQGINQTVSACVKDKGNVFFGISFYAGEGLNGVGGIGLFNPTTHKMEVRRLPILRDSSVTHIAYDGKYLWIATAHNWECGGTPPAIGLIRYDWNKDIVHRSDEISNGLCGFVVHDIHISDQSIWVATDLGVSQTYRTKNSYADGWEGGWRHYIPTKDNGMAMKKVWCKDLYNDLLATLPQDDFPTGGSSYDQLLDSLVQFKPRYIKDYIKSVQKRDPSK